MSEITVIVVVFCTGFNTGALFSFAVKWIVEHLR